MLGGRGDTPSAQEIGCHFSGYDPNALKLRDFFKNDVEPRDNKGGGCDI